MRKYNERYYDISYKTNNQFLDYILQHTQTDHTGDYGLCELLEHLKEPQRTLTKLNETEPTFDFNNIQLIEYMQEICTLIELKICVTEYYNELPKWIYNKHFYASEARYIIKRATPKTLATMFLRANNIFLQRNIYFDIDSLKRI